jgi:hypothetical protein
VSNYNRVISSRHADNIEKSQVLEGVQGPHAVGRAGRSASDERRRDPVRTASDERRRDSASDPPTATTRRTPWAHRVSRQALRAFLNQRRRWSSREERQRRATPRPRENRARRTPWAHRVSRQALRAFLNQRPRWSSREERQRRATPRPRERPTHGDHAPYAWTHRVSATLEPSALAAQPTTVSCAPSSTNDAVGRAGRSASDERRRDPVSDPPTATTRRTPWTHRVSRQALRAFLNQRRGGCAPSSTNGNADPARSHEPGRRPTGQMSAPSSSSSLSSSSESYLTYLMPASTSPSKPRRPSSSTSTRSHMRRTEPAAWLT